MSIDRVHQTAVATGLLQSARIWPTQALVALLTLPWIWPLTAGPSANVLPVVVSWCCLFLALGVLIGAAQPLEALREGLPRSLQIAAVVSAVIGLAQWFGVAEVLPAVHAADLGQAYGNLRQRNQFSTLLNLGLAAFIWAPGLSHPAIRLAAIVLIAAANAASASRTGALQLLLLVVLAAAWRGPRRQRVEWAAVAVGAYLIAVLLLPLLLWHWRGVEFATAVSRAAANFGCSSRQVLWSNVLNLIAERPWTGWGWGELDFAHYATLFAGPRFCDILDNAHNLPLHLAVEFGLPVAGAFLVGLWAWVWRNHPWTALDPVQQGAWSLLLLIGLHSLLEYPLWYGPFQVTVVGALLVLHAPPMQPSKWRWSAAAVAVLGLATAGVVLARYAVVSQAYLPSDQRWASMRVNPVAGAGDHWLFADQAAFAELSITPLTQESALHVHELASRMLHFSPEPAVIEKAIDSAWLLGRTEEAAWHVVRFRAAFPDRYEQWSGRLARASPPFRQP